MTHCPTRPTRPTCLTHPAGPGHHPLAARAGTALACLALCAALLGQPAQARERHSAVTGPQGQSATRDAERSQGDVSSTSTGPQGRQWQRAVDRSKGGSTATVTTPGGKAVTRNTTTSATAGATTGAPATTPTSAAP